MDKSLKKSIYLGASALALVATLGLAATKADAATITSNSYMSTSGNSRNANVNATGSNAIYTKAGILKGARVVADKAKVAQLRDSKAGKDNLRVYKVATTSRGTVYYKVVTFDKTVRGWIYGGTTKNVFGGGLVSYETTKEAKVPSTVAAYKLTSTSATSNTTLFREPAWTQYKAGRALDASGKVITSTDAFKNMTFTLAKAVTTSREGDTWYQIKSSDTNLNNAWVKSSDVVTTDNTDDNGAIANNQVRVTFVDIDSDKTIGSYTATKLGSEATPMDTLDRLSDGGSLSGKGTAAATISNSWYNYIPKLNGYSFTGLSQGERSVNDSALNTVTYGQEVKVKVKKTVEGRAFAKLGMRTFVDQSAAPELESTEEAQKAAGLEPNATMTGAIEYSEYDVTKDPAELVAIHTGLGFARAWKKTVPAVAPATDPTIEHHMFVSKNSEDAYIQAAGSTTKVRYNEALDRLLGNLVGNKGENMATQIPEAVKKAGLDDFYVVYDKTTGGLVNTDISLLTGSDKYQIWHYKYTGASGNMLAQTGVKDPKDVPLLSYSIVSKNVSINQADTTKAWSTIFGNN